MNIALTAFLLVSTGTSAPTMATPKALAPITVARITTWDDVDTYISAHASPMDYETEALLEAEAQVGTKTWTKVVPTGGSGSASPFVGFTLDGPGVGWPSANHVLRFPTTTERDVAAQMIDDVTAQNGRGPR